MSARAVSEEAPADRCSVRPRLAASRAVLAVALVALASGCLVSDDPTPSSNVIRIGALLPFTGSRAAAGAELERAMRLAASRVNAAGGIWGTPLALEVRDTHSDLAIGTAAAGDLLDSLQVRVIVGPEEPEIVHAIETAVKSHEAVQVLPGLTSPYFYDPSGSAAWVRLTPPPEYLACALVKRILNDGARRVAAVLNQDDYSGLFGAGVNRTVAGMGGTSLPSVRVSADQDSYSTALLALSAYHPDAIVLVAPPALGASVLAEWGVLGLEGTWYLTPTLKDREFVLNAPARIVNGAFGVTAAVGTTEDAFAADFLADSGAAPRDASYFYYDALALVALGLAEAVAESGTIPDALTLKRHMLRVASPPGEVIGSRDLARGLQVIAEGGDVEYRGAVGGYSFSDTGNVTGSRGAIWQLKDGLFVPVENFECTATEVGLLDTL